MKKVTIELTDKAVLVSVSAPECDDVNLEFPVNMVSPQVSLQIASMLAGDPKLPKPISNETAEK